VLAADHLPGFQCERLFGGCDLFHSGPFFVPRMRTGALVTTVYDLTPVRFPEYHLRSNRFTVRALKRRLDRADLVIVPSRSTADDLISLIGIAGAKIRTVPLGVGATFRPVPGCGQELLERLGIRGDFILAVGAVEPRKNLAGLLEALQILKVRHGIRHQLVIAGPAGWGEGPLRQAVLRRSLEKDVIFTGFVSDGELNELYNRAALLAYPSLYEGFGLPPLEAMAAGCPVAVSQTSSLPEVVGDAGLYFDPRDPEAIAGAVRRILDSSRLRSELAGRGLERSRAFSWARAAELTRAIYEEALAARAQRG
jgi:glycosyltransferase involved in cell wall biosynthesis